MKRLLYCLKMQVTNLGRRQTWVAEQYPYSVCHAEVGNQSIECSCIDVVTSALLACGAVARPHIKLEI